MNKIISLDLDGTLFRNNKTISNHSIDVIKKCKERGCKVIIATARTSLIVKKMIPKEIEYDYLVCHNGAHILHDGETVFIKPIKGESLAKIIKSVMAMYPEIGNAYKIDNVIYIGHDAENLYKGGEYKPISVGESLDSYVKILLDFRRISLDDNIHEIIPDDCYLLITDKGEFGQVMPKNISKLEALKYIVNENGGNIKDVIAFGDDFNDMELISSNCIGVAMGNAIEELKDAADFVTKTNEEDGVAYFLESYILK